MTGATRRILSQFAALVPPGLVLLLLGIQVAFGLRGFDRPDDSLLYVLQVPGILLGWGGVALLVPLLAWMIMDWWGYDLNGFALKGLGSAVLGVAFGALVAIGGGVAGGGLVGAGLASLLVGTLGTGFAVVLLLVMVGPAGVLALSMQRAPAPRDDAPAARRAAAVAAAAAPERETHRRFRLRLPWRHRRGREQEDDDAGRAWYPERRYDAQGNELPLTFGGQRDVGEIRYAQAPEEEEPTASQETRDAEAGDADELAAAGGGSETEEERLPTIPELLSGQFDRARLLAQDEGTAPDEDDAAEGDEADDDGPIHVDSEGCPIRPPARRARRPATGATRPASEEAASLAPPGRAARRDEPSLPPGVHWADEKPARESVPTEEAAGALGTNGRSPARAPAAAATRDLPRGVREALRHTAPSATSAPGQGGQGSLRASLRESFEAIQTADASDRYLAKLEASGIFDDIGPVDVDPASSPKPRASAKAAARRKAAPKKRPPARRRAAKKRAAKKKAAKKKVAKKKVAKKKVAKRKVATKRAAKKKSAKKKAPARRATKKRPAKRTAPRKKAAGRKLGARTARKTGRADPAVAARRRLLAGLRKQRGDPLFVRAVEAALERGAATPVLYTRRLGLPYDRARDMVDRLVDVGVLGEATRSGAHPVQLSQEDWAATAP